MRGDLAKYNHQAITLYWLNNFKQTTFIITQFKNSSLDQFKREHAIIEIGFIPGKETMNELGK